MNVRVDLNYPIKDGTEVVFRSPVDCSQVTGLKVYYIGDDGIATSKEFAFADAHGNNVGDIDHLFAENVAVKVILDVTTGMAFVQNADTNAYLEAQLASKASAEPLIVNVTADGDNYTTDCTSAEIYEAVNANRSVFMLLNGVYYACVRSTAESATFTASWITDDILNYSTYAISGNVVTVKKTSSAPAGYGLGEVEGKSFDDFNTAILPGFYAAATSTGAVNYPTVYANLKYGVLLVERRGDYIYQTVTRGNIVAKRYSTNSGATWSEWGFVNPIMSYSYDYLTTEMFMEKPVYVKIVNCGSVSNGKQVDLGVTGIFRVGGFIRNKQKNADGVYEIITSLPNIAGTLDNADSAWLSVNSATGKATLHCGSNYNSNSHNFFIHISYIK